MENAWMALLHVGLAREKLERLAQQLNRSVLDFSFLTELPCSRIASLLKTNRYPSLILGSLTRLLIRVVPPTLPFLSDQGPQVSVSRQTLRSRPGMD